MTEKLFVTAVHAARALGVDVSVVVADIVEEPRAFSLVGGMYGGVPVVYAYEIAEPRLSMHRARLGGAAGGATGTGCQS